MKHTVYAISSTSRNYIYVGMTSKIKIRLKRYNDGLNKTTAPYAPFKLLFTEEVAGTQLYARKREKYWKSVTGKRKLRVLRDSI
ncbi:MAG: GIY-YIG nuclease family protein [Nonlabens sp.]